MTEHTHHWIIDAAVGPVSTGRCKYCNATREFINEIFSSRTTMLCLSDPEKAKVLLPYKSLPHRRFQKRRVEE